MQIPQFFRTEFSKLALAALLGGGVAFGIGQAVNPERPLSISERQAQAGGLFHTANVLGPNGEALPDFREAASHALPAVVHIQNTPRPGASSSRNRRLPQGFEEFFGDPGAPRESSGSGVIISADGYIVSNNHVVEGGGDIKVTLFDNRSVPARLVGTDPSTDLALLKIDLADLPFVPFGNSDNLVVGEWVLAVGNPFNLTSTVTAGIVSAKARNIGILNDQFRIESFIQTDAAINPGNSGGALINTKGELVGINTAIASRTGSYVGYGFAVPVSIVRKVVDDLTVYGQVQRAFLGITIQDVNATLAQERNLRVTRGVYINKVNDNSAAQDGGLKPGDVILKVNNREVNTSSELQEQIGRLRPGDQVTVVYNRDGNERSATLTLKNQSGTTALGATAETRVMESLGAEFQSLTDAELRTYKVERGVKVKKVGPGALRMAGVREGFCITHIDRRPVGSVEDVVQALQHVGEQGVLIAGVYADGSRAYYALGQ
jgi:Do/DeqQ family serine protease